MKLSGSIRKVGGVCSGDSRRTRGKEIETRLAEGCGSPEGGWREDEITRIRERATEVIRFGVQLSGNVDGNKCDAD